MKTLLLTVAATLFVLFASAPVGAQEVCASFSWEDTRRGSDSVTHYYRFTNNCSEEVYFRWTDNLDSTQERERFYGWGPRFYNSGYTVRAGRSYSNNISLRGAEMNKQPRIYWCVQYEDRSRRRAAGECPRNHQLQ